MGIRIDIEWDFVSPALAVCSGVIKIWEIDHNLKGPEQQKLILTCKCKKEPNATGFSSIDDKGIPTSTFKLFEETIKLMLAGYHEGMMLDKLSWHWMEETLQDDVGTFEEWSKMKGCK